MYPLLTLAGQKNAESIKYEDVCFMDDLINLIKKRYHTFSKGHKAIATYITNHYDKVGFGAAAQLGKEGLVSVSQRLYDFQQNWDMTDTRSPEQAGRELIKSKLTSVQRLEVSSSRLDKENVLKSVLQADMNRIKRTLEEIDEANFNTIIEEIPQRKAYLYPRSEKLCVPGKLLWLLL